MQTATVQQPLNATQLHLLQMFSFTKTEKTLHELKKLLRNFYIQQVEQEAKNYPINDLMLQEHLRTPYK